MLELLMVIVIIGILSALTVPAVTGGDMTRVKSASRALMQMSRYARTMAILHQCTVELHIYPDGKLVTVPRNNKAPEEKGEDSGAAPGGVVASPIADSQRGQGGADAPPQTNPEDLGGAMVEIEEEKQFKRIVFELDDRNLEADSYEEQIRTREDDDDSESDDAVSGQPWIIPFGGNGRCPPFSVKVMSSDDEGEPERDAFSLDVRVDRFGSAKVYDEKDSHRDRD
jgi:type II secretory pathway pseudopilin PulG